MATATATDRIIHTCALCGNRWNPQFVSFSGCPYCHGTGIVVLKVSAAEDTRRQKARKARFKQRFEATYEVSRGPLPAWNVFWAFVFHDARARGILEIDLGYCESHGIIRRKTEVKA